MLRDLHGEHLCKGEGHSGQLPLSDFFSLIPCHWSLGMDGYCGRQAKERSPKLLGKTRESGSRKGQAVVPTGFLPFWVSGLRLQLSTLVSLAW